MHPDVVRSSAVLALGLVLALPSTGARLAQAQTPPPPEQTAAPSPVVKDFQTSRAYQVFDRVKAVPKKELLKRHRFELSAQTSVSLNDGFYTHLSLGGQASFYIHDAFGVGVGADYLYTHAKSAALAEVRTALSAAPAALTLPSLFAHANVYWLPLYGKVSLPGGGIAQFDVYATLGAGIAGAFGGRNPPAVNIGLGQHYVINSFMALRLEVRDTLFLDRQAVDGVARSGVQSFVMFNAGLSFFVPKTFEYTYP